MNATTNGNQPPRSPDGLAEGIRPLVERLHAELDQLSYYKLLGVGRGASRTAIQQAFYRRAVQLHPDRHFRLEDAQLKEKIVAVYKRIAEGYRVLSSESHRRKYDRELRRGQLRVRKDAYDLPAATTAKHSGPQKVPIGDQKADSLYGEAIEKLRNREFDIALDLLERARRLCPESPRIQRKIDDANRLKRLWT
jgi:curved DNA-binding protein CbpA